MSAIELYLKQAKEVKGTVHKIVIQNLREYMATQPEEEIVSAINKIKDPMLFPYLWEVGLSQDLQDLVNKRTLKLAGKSIKEVK